MIPSADKQPLVGWCLVLLLCLVYCTLRILQGGVVESNILSLLPQTSGIETPLAQNQDLQPAFAVLVKDPGDASAVAVLQSRLSKLGGIDLVQNQADSLEQLSAFYRPWRRQLLTADQRQALLQSSTEELAEARVRQLYSPLPDLHAYAFYEDPFNLGGHWLQQLFSSYQRIDPGPIPLLVTEQERWYILQGRLHQGPFNLAQQQQLTTVLAEFNSQYPAVELLRSGLIFHAAEATTTAKREISTVGLGSMLAIILLVGLSLRSATALAAIGFTLISSLLLAVTISLMVFGRLHLLTLALGSTLIGLAVDYVFHFLLKYREQYLGESELHMLMKGVWFSAGSSILAYGVQVISPFPGLQQFAVFVATGLLGAAVAVSVLARCYRETRATQTVWFYQRRVEPGLTRLSRHYRTLLTAILAVIAALVWQVTTLPPQDDIRLLNISSEQLLAEEARVQSLIGGVDTQRYWRVRAEDEQSLLELLEATLTDLPIQVETVSQMLPSQRQQREDYQLIEQKIYAPGAALDLLCRQLNQTCDNFRRKKIEFRQDLVLASLTPLQAVFPLRLAGDITQAFIFPQKNSGLTSDQLAQLKIPQAMNFVDQVAQISASLASFRIKVSVLLLIFLLVFTVICVAAYRWRAILVIVAVTIALLVGLLMSAPTGISLFHVLALLLVLGIAMDTVIFYLELGLNGSTWQASTLSTLTSVMAFGLLSLSSVPVLHQFGSVVFYGLLAAWLLTPLFFLITEQMTNNYLRNGYD